MFSCYLMLLFSLDPHLKFQCSISMMADSFHKEITPEGILSTVLIEVSWRNLNSESKEVLI